MAKILVSEDEKSINELIIRNLKLVGHDPKPSFDGVDTLEKMDSGSYDLALLDVMMPGLSGFEIKQRTTGDTPVIFVTAKDSLSSRLEGLGLGADDYIVKPFEILELLARVEAVLRRTKKQIKSFTFRDITAELDKRQVFRGGREIALTKKEYDLFETLIINRNLALPRERLLELVWGYDFEGESRTVDMHILRLRKKLGLENAIQTVYKLGYRFNTREFDAGAKG